MTSRFHSGPARYGRKAHRHPARAIIRNIRDARVAHFNDIALPLTCRHKKFPLSSVVATNITAGNDPSTDRCVIYKGYVEDLDHRGCNNLDLRWLDTPFDSRGSEEALSMCELWHNAYDRLEYWDHHFYRPQAGIPFSMDKLPQSIIDELDPDLESRDGWCRREITDLEAEPILKLYYERIYWLLDDHMAAELYQARDVILEEVFVKWRSEHPTGELW